MSLGDTLVSGFNAGSQAKARWRAQQGDDQERPYRISNLQAIIAKLQAETDNTKQATEEGKADFEQRQEMWKKWFGDAASDLDKASEHFGDEAVKNFLLAKAQGFPHGYPASPKMDGIPAFMQGLDPAKGSPFSSTAPWGSGGQPRDIYGPPAPPTDPIQRAAYDASNKGSADAIFQAIAEKSKRDKAIGFVKSIATKSPKYAQFLMDEGGLKSLDDIDKLDTDKLLELLAPTTVGWGRIDPDGYFGNSYSQKNGLDPSRFQRPPQPVPTTIDEAMQMAMRGQFGNG